MSPLQGLNPQAVLVIPILCPYGTKQPNQRMYRPEIGLRLCNSLGRDCGKLFSFAAPGIIIKKKFRSIKKPSCLRRDGSVRLKIIYDASLTSTALIPFLPCATENTTSSPS